jgi:quercetin dioxygenase-like cupin family protein
VDLAGDGTHLLGVGDVLYFSGGVRHRWRASRGRTARALVVQAGHNPHV